MSEYVRVGTDTSGRPILMTPLMRDWWGRVVAELAEFNIAPTIVQGAYMTHAGGGATDSAGYHDLGGCLDLRTWDLSTDGAETLVRVLRLNGAAAWRRDERHGMDPHLHLVLGVDRPASAGAIDQWGDYLAGRDGLADNGPDYEWRPRPLVTTPPEDDMTPEQAATLGRIATTVDRLERAETKRAAQARTQRSRIVALVKEGATKDDLLAALAEEDA